GTSKPVHCYIKSIYIYDLPNMQPREPHPVRAAHSAGTLESGTILSRLSLNFPTAFSGCRFLVWDPRKEGCRGPAGAPPIGRAPFSPKALFGNRLPAAF